MANERAFIPEYIFITYDGIIKNYRPSLIKKILKNHKEAYRQFIDVDALTTYNDAQLMGLTIQSLDLNILKYLSIKPFDYDGALNEIYSKFPSLYVESDLLVMGHSVKRLLKEKFTSKIYIWTPTYDKRIHYDIQSNFQDMDKVEYITGSFSEVINSITPGITTYMLNDVELVKDLIAIGKVKYTNILLGDYGFNYTLDENNKVILNLLDIDEKSKENIFKLGTFNVADNYQLIEK